MNKKYSKMAFAGMALTAAMTASSFALADGHTAAATGLAESQIKVFAESPAVIGAIRTQNEMHKGLTAADIDKLDKEWRKDKKAGGNGDLIQGKLHNALAGYLNYVKAHSNGLITEIFVMDNKGLNVGQTNKTGDYMQGDEGKWQNTYGKGPGAIDISPVEADGGVNVTQVSVAITDPDTLKNIGAVTVGVNADKLMMMK